MSTVFLVFAPKLFGDGWPSSRFCSRGHYVKDDVVDRWNNSYQQNRWVELGETGKCRKAKINLRIVMGVAGGVSILIAYVPYPLFRITFTNYAQRIDLNISDSPNSRYR